MTQQVKTTWDARKGLQVNIERQSNATNRLKNEMNRYRSFNRKRNRQDKVLALVALIILLLIFLLLSR